MITRNRVNLRTKKRGQSVRTYYAMAYNPYGEGRSTYAETSLRNTLTAIPWCSWAREFWGLIGSPGTYEEVLEPYEQVGREFKDEV